MWILASSQLTSEPFIQILPVPKDMRYSFGDRTTALRGVPRPIRDGPASLLLVTKRTAIGARVKRLAAVPAEPRGRRLAGAQPRLDALDVVASGAAAARARYRGGLRCARRGPRRQYVVEQVGGALIPRGRLGRHRLHHDVADRLGDGGVLQPRRRDQFA